MGPVLRTRQAVLDRRGNLVDANVVGLDLRGLDWSEACLKGCLFLGCEFDSADQMLALFRRGAHFFPHFEGLPYDTYRTSLYTWQELLDGYHPDHDTSLDRRIYDHFQARGRLHPDMREALARRLHDHAMNDGLEVLLADRPRVVGIMGGHGISRADPMYARVAYLGWRLTREGYFITTGGGPGLMEAGNLGAYLSVFPRQALDRACQMLAAAPTYRDAGFVPSSRAVLEEFPNGADSLAVPTWFYGHEPSNVFGTHIAKFFSNSLREDGLLAMALHGIVYTPGSAGTTQEIFQDATQNHYGTFEYYSPMVFMGVERYTRDTAIYPLLRQVSEGQVYHDLLFLSDDPDEVVNYLLSHPPLKV